MKFRLVESIINEVYPNKGESKKDFISRFMSVTKDEYPDIKQRFAVANSYWSRRNKKKVNESQESDTLQKLIDFFGVSKKPSESATYILPSGDFLYTTDLDGDFFPVDEHMNIYYYLNDIGIKDTMYDGGSKFLHDLGAIRSNSYYGYIQLNKDKKPTQEQYDALETLFGLMVKDRDPWNEIKNGVEVNIGDKRKIYSFEDYTPEEIVKKIKRYYSSGVLYESK